MSATSGAAPSCSSISSLPSARPRCVCRTVQSNQRAVHSLDQPLAQSMPQPSCAQILLFFKTSSNAGLAEATSPFRFPFPPSWQLWPPALDLALILLVLLHPVLCWAVSGNISPSCSGQTLCREFTLVSQNRKHREPSGCACPIPGPDLEEKEMGWD